MNKQCLVNGINKHAFPLVLFALWALYLFSLYNFNLWAYVGVPHMKPLFADLHAILAAAECSDKGLNVFVTNPCDVLGRIHVYGSLWLKISHLGLQSQHLFMLGLGLNLIFMLLTVFLIQPKTLGQLALSCLIVFSPAVTLGIERANNDPVIFILIALGAILLTYKTRLAFAASLALIYLSSLLKIYPSILFGTVLLFAKQQTKGRVLIFGFSCVLGALWLATNLNEILLLKDLVPRPLDHYVTGLQALFTYVGRPYPQILLISEAWRLALFVGLIAAGALVLARRLKLSDFQPTQTNLQYILFLFGLSTLFFTYVINSNYDYRWIFFILLMPNLLSLQQTAANNSLAKSLVNLGFIFAAVVMWTEAFRATRLFGLYNFNVYFNLGTSTFSTELLQQFIKEFSAWFLFIILFAIAIKQFSKR
jgi:hypothetical protein